MTPRKFHIFLVVALMAATSARAATLGADAVVFVNSASDRYLDFRNHIQPYLDHFGVPYTVVDIRTNLIGTNVANYALAIIGHDRFDTNHLYFPPEEQAHLLAAVSNGTGLVNFDSALSPSAGVVTPYDYVQGIFGFGYGSSTAGTNGVTFPATENGSQLHYVTALHATNDLIALRSNLVLAGLTHGTNVTALALSGSRPMLLVTGHGAGRAVQWGGYGWMTMAVKGPVAGLDDLVWRSLVWAARKPFVMCGMPNFVTLRVDDIAGPTLAASGESSLTNWVQIAVETGFKPYLSLFFNCLDGPEIAFIRNIVTNGSATVSIHSHGDCPNSSTGFFYFDHSNLREWSDSTMANKYVIGTQWHQTNGIPISKVVTPHYSEIGTNAFNGLKEWGVEFVPIEIIPGQVEYPSSGPGAPWLVAGPYRLYETPLPGKSPYPFYYADFLTVPNHPELDGWFFNCYTEIRDDAPCQEWCPDNNIPNSIGRGVRQLKRAFDSMVVGTLFTHDYYMYPIPNNPDKPTIITSNNWRLILEGVTNGIAAYQPRYVTLDYANQYARATRTAKLAAATYDPVSGGVSLTLTGRADLELSVQVFVGADNAITNVVGAVPPFTNSVTIESPAVNVPPTITAQPQGAAVTTGTNFIFAINAVGTSPISFQWRHGGTNISEATNATYSLSSVQSGDAGIYDVVVSNLVGATLSSNALLTVERPPPAPPFLHGAAQSNLFFITFNTEPDFAYIVEYRDHLDAGSWLLLTNFTAVAANTVVSDPIVSLQRFYRARLMGLSPEEIFLFGIVQGGQFVLSFNARTGHSYTIECSDAWGAWMPLTNLTAQSTNIIFADPITGPQRFYRVQTPAN